MDTTISRRDASRLMIGGALAAFGAAGVRFSAEASAETPVRRDLATLSDDHRIMRTFRAGVAEMRARSDKNPLDPLGWHTYGAAHSIFCATNAFRMQVHYGWLFLPWHRAYSINLEQRIRHLTGDASFAVPYWDWTKPGSHQLPTQFRAEVDGTANPLHDTTRLQDQGDQIPLDFLDLNAAMSADLFHNFGGVRRDPSEAQIEGTLEQGVHNNVHNWIGGNMASFDGAGFDPIFNTHHGNIDRLWEGWRQSHPNGDPQTAEWLDSRLPFYGLDGLVETVRIGDLLDIKAQGFVYDRTDWRPTLTAETTPEYPGGSSSLAQLRLTDAQKVEIAKLIDAPQAGRVLLQYSRIQLPVHPLCHRVFILSPSEATDADETNAAYVGTFTLLPIPDPNEGLEKLVSTQMQVPPRALKALLDGADIRVVVVPVPLKKRNIPTEPLQLEGVRLTIET